MLSLRNILCNLDPFLASSLLELNDVAFNLSPTIVLWTSPS